MEPDFAVKIEKEEFVEETFGETSCPYSPEFVLAKDEYFIKSSDLPKNGPEHQEELNDPVKIEKKEFIEETHDETSCPYISETDLSKSEYVITSLDLPQKSPAHQKEKFGMNSDCSSSKLKTQKNVSMQRKNKKRAPMLHKNILTNTGLNPLECNSCSAIFAQKCDLVRHIRSHTGEKPFQCNSCTAKFARKDHLINHIRTHTGEKSFECNSCSARFVQKCDLVNHIRTHTGEKPFQCNSCSARFSRKSHLISHIRTHTGEKPFPCSSCSARFAQKCDLVNHIRTHTGEKPFQCNSCSARFARKGHLIGHIRTHC